MTLSIQFEEQDALKTKPDHSILKWSFVIKSKIAQHNENNNPARIKIYDRNQILADIMSDAIHAQLHTIISQIKSNQRNKNEVNLAK